jgi:hypothetical protein
MMHPTRRVLIGLFFLIAAFVGVSPCAAEGLLIPHEVFVGDTAEFSFSTGDFKDLLEPGTLFVVPPEAIPVSSDLTIESIVVARKASPDVDSSVTIRFRPWISGVLRLPSFTLKGTRVSPPPTRIASLAEKTGKTELEGPRAPLLLPGTIWLIYGFGGAALLAALALIVFSSRLTRFLSQYSVRRQTGLRVRRLNRELRFLARQGKRLALGEWYARFSSVIRAYLASLCSLRDEAALSATASEQVASLSARFPDRQALAESLATLLDDVDVVRYSGREVIDERTLDIARLRAFSAEAEAAAEAQALAEREAVAKASAERGAERGASDDRVSDADASEDA